MRRVNSLQDWIRLAGEDNAGKGHGHSRDPVATEQQRKVWICPAAQDLAKSARTVRQVCRGGVLVHGYLGLHYLLMARRDSTIRSIRMYWFEMV